MCNNPGSGSSLVLKSWIWIQINVFWYTTTDDGGGGINLCDGPDLFSGMQQEKSRYFYNTILIILKVSNIHRIWFRENLYCLTDWLATWCRFLFSSWSRLFSSLTVSSKLGLSTCNIMSSITTILFYNFVLCVFVPRRSYSYRLKSNTVNSLPAAL